MHLRRSLPLFALLLALPASASAATHTVQPGQTLSGIAVAHGLSTASLAAANGLSTEAFVISGSALKLPEAGTSTASGSQGSGTAGGGYRVQPGDSLSGVAARLGLTQAQLAAVNGLDPAGWLISGTTLRLPGAGASTSAASGPSSSAAPEALGAYTVRPGDTLSGLAARSRVSLAQMAYVNGLDPTRPLLAGTVIKLPTGASINASAPAPAATVVPNASPQATSTRLSAGEITSIAAEHGAPGALAAAIAWQESGFNNGVISSANARGIMQVLPGTWDWVQSNLTTRRLDPASAHDNVRAGALYLAQLLRQTGGDQRLAAAGYYQGLASVRRIGLLPETERYVANVLALRSRFGG